jgi:hypothetical protein
MEPEQHIAHILAESIEEELLRLRQERSEKCRATPPHAVFAPATEGSVIVTFPALRGVRH